LKRLAAGAAAIAAALALAACGGHTDYTSTYPASFASSFGTACATSATDALFPDQTKIVDECVCALDKIEQTYPYSQMAAEAADLPPDVVQTVEQCRS
jgi:ABC-type glycerol-3-phosphate transport system substrate-binding protein